MSLLMSIWPTSYSSWSIPSEPGQVGAGQCADFVREPFAQRCVVAVGGFECCLEGLLVGSRQVEKRQKFRGVFVPNQIDDRCEFGVAGLHLLAQRSEQRIYIRLIVFVLQFDEVDEFAVGQLGGKPDVGFAEDLFDVAAVVFDLVLRDEHLDQRDAELRPFVADGDVVGVDVSQIVIFVHACGGEHAGQEQEDKFSYRLGV